MQTMLENVEFLLGNLRQCLLRNVDVRQIMDNLDGNDKHNKINDYFLRNKNCRKSFHARLEFILPHNLVGY